MEKYAAPGVEVLPCHPMFGPRIRSLDGQVVVLTPVKTGKWYDKVLKFSGIRKYTGYCDNTREYTIG